MIYIVHIKIFQYLSKKFPSCIKNNIIAYINTFEILIYFKIKHKQFNWVLVSTYSK